MTGVGTYWRTVRHLKPAQLVDRVVFRLRRPSADLRPAPPLHARTDAWKLPARRAPSLEAPATFDLLGARHALADVGWDGPGVERLWRYHQHYFDDLNADGAPERRALHGALIERWLAANPPGAGAGWEPYPLSLRIVNWIKWLAAGNEGSPAVIASLAVQARWLAKRLETHLLGNHLFANAKALVFAGLFFTDAEAASWLRLGTRLLLREVPEQILADGGQFERSPMYHALALEDILDLLNAIATWPSDDAKIAALRDALAARVPSMLRWLRAMTHPDGTLGRFNDCADGIAPPNAELFRLAADLAFEAAPDGDEQGVLVLPESGYVRVECGPAVALLDVAPVGPDYLPGHAHADTLSFELSLAGRRLVVNGGTSCYGDGAQRRRERSTAAHSTVEIADGDSSEVWAGFRVGRRARVSGPRVERAADAIRVEGSHDGYTHLAGAPVHRRAWRFDPAGLVIEDAIGAANAVAVARFHLAPGLALVACGAGRWRIGRGAAVLAEIDTGSARARVEPSFHAPRFGVVEATSCLAVALARGGATTRWTWAC